MARIRSAHVLVVGTGGVGAYAAEMLCRAGVGHLTLVDADTVSPSNINRQLPALHSTLGRSKVSVLAERFRDINPEVQLTLREEYLTPESVDALLDAAPYAYVIDAIDTIQLTLIEQAVSVTCHCQRYSASDNFLSNLLRDLNVVFHNSLFFFKVRQYYPLFSSISLDIMYFPFSSTRAFPFSSTISS